MSLTYNHVRWDIVLSAPPSVELGGAELLADGLELEELGASAVLVSRVVVLVGNDVVFCSLFVGVGVGAGVELDLALELSLEAGLVSCRFP